MGERIIKTGLRGQKNYYILDALMGQLSDGMWENSPRMEWVWKFIDIELRGKEVVFVVSEDYHNHDFRFIWNKFIDMDDEKIKSYMAGLLKSVVKEEGCSWKRDNDEITEYLSQTEMDISVSDVYYAYEVLKGRNVLKHPEYNNMTESYEEDEDIEENDGWDLDDYDTRVFEDIEEMLYEIRNCVRGCVTGCKTKKELGKYIHNIAERLNDLGYELDKKENIK